VDVAVVFRLVEQVSIQARRGNRAAHALVHPDRFISRVTFSAENRYRGVKDSVVVTRANSKVADIDGRNRRMAYVGTVTSEVSSDDLT
jgi:hypothetical protein